MNLYIRVLIVFLRSCFSVRIPDILSPTRLRLRVLPNDLDFNMHMNNGRYLSVMDLGRLNLIMRAGLLGQMVRRGAGPVLAAMQMRYRLPLGPFQIFDLETRVLCWDEKWVYMEQRFMIAGGPKAGAIAAIGLVKGGFFDSRSGKMIPTGDLLALMRTNPQSPEFPSYVREWIAAEEALRTGA